MVMVDQPSVDDTISILRGLKERYELHHGVRIKDSALSPRRFFRNRYISDRFLPDKAIDLSTRSPAKLRTEIDSMPQEIDEISAAKCSSRSNVKRSSARQTTQQTRLAKIEAELAELDAEGTKYASNGTRERRVVKLRELREQIDVTKREIDQAERAYDLNERPSSAMGRWHRSRSS